MKKPVAVIDEEHEGGPKVLHRCDSIVQAENWIAEKEKSDPDKVHRGGYGIDAPEHMINP